MSDSRRGSLVPNGSRRGSGQRSRCGSISLGGVERRGSYYSEVSNHFVCSKKLDRFKNVKAVLIFVKRSNFLDQQDVSKRSTVAVVVDDPEGKKQVSILFNIFRHF